MKQVAVVSGKGGTGKTTVVAALAHLCREAVTVDCDVDAANLALLLPGTDDPEQAFFAGQRASIDPAGCTLCGQCQAACRFGAVDLELRSGLVQIDPLACEGCGVCAMVCPVDAVRLAPNRAGVWMVRRGPLGTLVHARLGIAQGNSGKLVAQVREVARQEAQASSAPLVLIDGPPGIGCPVHAAITGVDLVLAVTEPTPSGEHDLARLLALCRSFQLPVALVINKADLSPTHLQRLERLANRSGVRLLGRLPFSREVPQQLARGKQLLDQLPLAEAMNRIWLRLHALLLDPQQRATGS